MAELVGEDEPVGYLRHGHRLSTSPHAIGRHGGIDSATMGYGRFRDAPMTPTLLSSLSDSDYLLVRATGASELRGLDEDALLDLQDSGQARQPLNSHTASGARRT